MCLRLRVFVSVSVCAYRATCCNSESRRPASRDIATTAPLQAQANEISFHRPVGDCNPMGFTCKLDDGPDKVFLGKVPDCGRVEPFGLDAIEHMLEIM
eukprot:11236740-Alexandrium_andersonii.AAC.1